MSFTVDRAIREIRRINQKSLPQEDGKGNLDMIEN
jgi:hypothetical protein